jgi:lactate dehydrogenase-like 2-hydroxyacid dehydrogenase
MSFTKFKQEVAIRAKAFGMSIIYNNRNRLPCEKEVGARFVSLAELIATSDVISLNLGLTESNRHMIGASEFANMKDGVVIVNTARGALIDEGAMLAALKSGKVSFILGVMFLDILRYLTNDRCTRLDSMSMKMSPESTRS